MLLRSACSVLAAINRYLVEIEAKVNPVHLDRSDLETRARTFLRLMNDFVPQKIPECRCMHHDDEDDNQAHEQRHNAGENFANDPFFCQIFTNLAPLK